MRRRHCYLQISSILWNWLLYHIEFIIAYWTYPLYIVLLMRRCTIKLNFKIIFTNIFNLNFYYCACTPMEIIFMSLQTYFHCRNWIIWNVKIYNNFSLYLTISLNKATLSLDFLKIFLIHFNIIHLQFAETLSSKYLGGQTH